MTKNDLEQSGTAWPLQWTEKSAVKESTRHILGIIVGVCDSEKNNKSCCNICLVTLP